MTILLTKGKREKVSNTIHFIKRVLCLWSGTCRSPRYVNVLVLNGFS